MTRRDAILRGVQWVRAACLVALSSVAACEASPFREVDLGTVHPTAPDAGARVPGHTLRMSVAAMESPRWTYSSYARLFDEVGRRLGMEVTFVQRRGYADVNALLASGDLDAALLCTGGYLDLARTHPGAVEPLVVPIVHDKDTYQALLIVPATSDARSLSDLRQKRFAFTDPLSLSGHTWIVRELSQVGSTPDAYFSRTIFTASHDRSITAVSRGLVDGAAVHELVYDHMVARDPPIAARTRVIQRSPPVGMTPVVASTLMPSSARTKLRDVLTGLADDPQGVALLRVVQVDRFVAPPPGLFQSAGTMVGK